MGKRGPAPEPTVIQMLKGNPSKKAVNHAEPTPDAVPLDCPPPPELNDQAAEVWREMVAVLTGMRVLTQADLQTLSRYCITKVLYLAALKKVNAGGEEYTHWEDDPHNPGKRRIKFSQVAPWSTALHRHHAALLRMEQEFGMTPSSRSQVKVHGSSNPASPLAQWAARHSAG